MSELRKTSQYLIPVKKDQVLADAYDIYPTFDLGEGKIMSDFISLSERIKDAGTVVVDGYVGVTFESFRSSLDAALKTLGVNAAWTNVDMALKNETEINELLKPYLGGDDPIFGYRCPLQLEDLFDKNSLESLNPNSGSELNIIYGCGASLASWDGLLVYLDIPKNEIQFRSRSGKINNLGCRNSDTPKRMYKRFYFADWVLLNKHKKSLLPSVDIFVDAQREYEITWAEGSVIREGLENMAKNGFRPRPWFEPGAWGGQWIRENIAALPHDVPNYAWSFEMIVPENGLIFSSSSAMLELSFDYVMYQSGDNVVGKDCYAAYGDEFPIRLDYLDNIQGGNLSIQCHPRKEYIQKNFGEVLTQEETYYVLQTLPDSVVYLGFKDDIVPEKFENALTESYQNATSLDVNKYINSEPSVKHNLYLIPPGTLHSSGKGNLVLEISTTPYIFTFKMYDWMALDLDGKPRPINIKRAMDNLYFDRKGEKIANEFVSHPYKIENGNGWELWHMPTHPNHSYDVHRYVVTDKVDVLTEGKCHALNLVEGTSATIVTENGMKFHLSYAESFIIPAAANKYTIVSDKGEKIMLIKAFMK